MPQDLRIDVDELERLLRASGHTEIVLSEVRWRNKFTRRTLYIPPEGTDFDMREIMRQGVYTDGIRY